MSILDRILPKKERVLNIIIVGAGKVGTTLAEKLTIEHNNVVIIDKNQELVNRLSTTYDIMGIAGNGSSYGTLIEAGIEKADLIIAVTDSDELNLLCCTLAKKVGNCSSIARVRTPDYSDELPYLRDKLEISMIINPELEAAKEINRILHFPSAIAVNSFAKGSVDMITFKIAANCALCGVSLKDFRNKDGFKNILVCGVERDGELFIPDGYFTLQATDTISFVATPKNTYRFFKCIGMGSHKVNSSIIIGGGKTSFYLAKFLVQSGISVKIIENNFSRCQELNELLPENVIVVNGDGTDEALLQQENLTETDAVIPLTGLDEENILLSLYAMKAAPGIKAVTKVNHISFSNVINELELGSVVYPRYMIAESILTYVRAKRNSIGSNIETLYHIFHDRAEAIEFKIDSDAEYTNIPLKALKLKKNLLIAAVIRNGRCFIPDGDSCFMPEDTVIIVTTHSGFNSIYDILG